MLSECLIARRGYLYNGSQSRSRSGYTCQRWDRQSPQSHSYTNINKFVDNNYGEASNFCRNPDPGDDVPDPWCYTLNIRWEYCSIPKCLGAYEESIIYLHKLQNNSGCKLFGMWRYVRVHAFSVRMIIRLPHGSQLLM